jgi:integrase
VVQLIYTTSAFTPEGTAAPDVPLLLDEEMRLIEPACLWFFNIALVRGRTRSPNTWRSYAEAIYDWFQTCSANSWKWDDITDDQIAAYRNRMLTGPSSYTGKPYSRRTINGRLRRIMLFYKWCFRNGRIKALPFEYEQVSLGGTANTKLLAHLSANLNAVTANVLTVRERAHYPVALEPKQLRKIYEHLSQRDRLIAQWAVTTGLRRFEVLALTQHSIPETKRMSDQGMLIPMSIKTTKGGKPRNVYPSIRLVDRTNDYIYEERAAIIRRLRKKPGYVPPAALWLSKDGTPLSKGSLYKNYRNACKKAGADATFHDLRHTFSIKILAALQRQAKQRPDFDLNPLKVLQILLGHAHYSTTEIYLESLHLDMESIEDVVQALYESLI